MKKAKLTYQDKSLFQNYSLEVFNKADYLFFSGGTTGRPKVIPFSKKDWEMRTKYRSICYKKTGLNSSHNIAIMLPFGPWIAGPSAHEASLKTGCGTFPLGMVDSEMEMQSLLNLFNKHNIECIITTPGFLNFFTDTYVKFNYNFKLKFIYTSGEVTTKNLRKKIEKIFHVDIYSCYASSETFLGIECRIHNGYHFNRRYVDLKIREIENEKNNILVDVKGSDLIKVKGYRIGDLGLVEKKCECGWGWPKVLLTGRSEEGFLVNGAVNVFPYQIKDAILKSVGNFIECIVTVKCSKNIDILDFKIKTEHAIGNGGLKLLEDGLKNLSLDFSDVIHHSLVKIKVSNGTQKRNLSQQKSGIKINDLRKYAKEN